MKKYYFSFKGWITLSVFAMGTLFFIPNVLAQTQTIDDTYSEYKTEAITPIFDNVIDYEIILDNKYDPLKKELIHYENKVQIFYVTDYLATYDTEEEIISNNIIKRNSLLRIYSGYPFYNLDGTWYETGYKLVTESDFNNTEIKFLNVSTSKIFKTCWAQTYYPTAGDGWIDNDPGNSNWATSHGATAGGAGRAFYTDGTQGLRAKTVKDPYWVFQRSFIPFDTSGLDDSCVLDDTASSSVFLYVDDIYDLAEDLSYIGITGTNQADTSQLVTEDFDQFDFNLYSNEFDITSLIDNTYNKWTLNTNGIGLIEVSGVTKFGVLEGHDLENTITTSGTGNPGAFFSGSEYTGTSRDPFLLIECGEEEPETPTATTTLETIDDLNYSGDISIISGITKHYETSTLTPDWVETHYYHIPFFVWILFYLLVVFIFSRIIIELIIRWR